MPVSRFRVAKDRTYQVKQGVKQAVSDAIRKACFDIEAQAKLNVTDQDAIDTGALKASIYTVTDTGSSYSEASSEASAAASKPGRNSGKPNPNFKMLPEAQLSQPIEGVVAVGAEYASYVEFGTVHQAPRLFFAPAADDVTAVLDEIVDAINKAL